MRSRRDATDSKAPEPFWDQICRHGSKARDGQEQRHKMPSCLLTPALTSPLRTLSRNPKAVPRQDTRCALKDRNPSIINVFWARIPKRRPMFQVPSRFAASARHLGHRPPRRNPRREETDDLRKPSLERDRAKLGPTESTPLCRRPAESYPHPRVALVPTPGRKPGVGSLSMDALQVLGRRRRQQGLRRQEETRR